MEFTRTAIKIALILEMCAVNSYACRIFKDFLRSFLAILLRKEFPMPIDVTCPGCRKAYSVPDERAGQRFKCKACGTAVSVPADEWGYNSGNSAFGGNAAGFGDQHNPYATPVASSTHRTSRANALSKTKICAIFLFIVIGFSMVYHLIVGISSAMALAVNPGGVQAMNGPRNPDELFQGIGGITGGIIGIIMDVLGILGAYNLMKLKKYSLAMTGAIIACIPCCSPCLVLGIPFGIWALVLLNSPEIKPHFEG